MLLRRLHYMTSLVVNQQTTTDELMMTYITLPSLLFRQRFANSDVYVPVY